MFETASKSPVIKVYGLQRTVKMGRNISGVEKRANHQGLTAVLPIGTNVLNEYANTHMFLYFTHQTESHM